MVGDCPIFKAYGKCPRGLSCIFAASHTHPETRRNLVETPLWEEKQAEYEAAHRQLLDPDKQVRLSRNNKVKA